MTESEKSVDLKEKFLCLKETWRKETAYSSRIESDHPAYKQIIALGKSVVPIMLRDLEEEPNWWFEALATITEENPVREEQWGNLQQMADAWIEWGQKKGLLVNSPNQ